jgi:hypothetical protein
LKLKKGNPNILIEMIKLIYGFSKFTLPVLIFALPNLLSIFTNTKTIEKEFDELKHEFDKLL